MPCNKDINVEIAIIGGGMAGLSAAQAFNKKGKKVALFEQYYCGSGASGKSSGFITPNAELSLTDFADRYTIEVAQQIWNFIISGVQDIKTNIQDHEIICDYIPQDTVVLANSKKALKELSIEHANLTKLGYKTSYYNQNAIREYVNSADYFGGVRYEGSFGINGYLYCQALKKKLQQQGVIIFEETPVTSIDNHTLKTMHANIKADYIIVCVDRFMPELNVLKQEIYHAQTFLMISQQLTDQQVRTLFPITNLMAWDTDLIYTYFRLTGDNRLLVGGGNFLTTYSSKADHEYAPMVRKLTHYIHKKFPQLKTQFEQLWPGLIGLSKDIGPIAGRDNKKPYLYYISAAAGLPIAAALGRYSAEHILEGRIDLDPYFSPYRSFAIGGILQSVLGKKLSFALCNLKTRYIP
ncbi:MAG: FAD-binding oxidoreductase [Candidatus Babeliales bacterium]